MLPYQTLFNIIQAVTYLIFIEYNISFLTFLALDNFCEQTDVWQLKLALRTSFFNNLFGYFKLSTYGLIKSK